MSGPQTMTDTAHKVDLLHQATRSIEAVIDSIENVITQVEGATPVAETNNEKDGREVTLCEILNSAPDYLHNRANHALDRLNHLGDILR